MRPRPKTTPDPEQPKSLNPNPSQTIHLEQHTKSETRQNPSKSKLYTPRNNPESQTLNKPNSETLSNSPKPCTCKQPEAPKYHTTRQLLARREQKGTPQPPSVPGTSQNLQRPKPKPHTRQTLNCKEALSMNPDRAQTLNPIDILGLKL